MTCKFCNHSGQIATVSLPGFDGRKIVATIEVCDQDVELLRKVKR